MQLQNTAGFDEGCALAADGAMPQNAQSDGDLSNTILFVGGLDSDVANEVLRQAFSQYGEVISVKIPARIGCGFVQFANRNSTKDAMQRLTGVVISSQMVHLSWGRSPGNRQIHFFDVVHSSNLSVGIVAFDAVKDNQRDTQVRKVGGDEKT